MKFRKAYQALKDGAKIKRGHWGGYWVKENDTIMMYLKEGGKMDIRETEDIFFTFDNIAATDWEIVEGDSLPTIVHTFTFGEALRQLKQGKKVARKGWNGKGMFIYLVLGQHIPYDSLRNEAKDALANVPKREEDRITINPHIDMKAADGSIVVGWLASQTDMLAQDWCVVD